MRRYDLASLLAASRCTLDELRRNVHINGRQYRQILDEGLTEAQADRWASKLGLHPAVVWPDWWDGIDWSAADRADEERRERRRQIARDSARRRYHEDPDVRERRKASAKAWRDASPRALQHQPSRQPEARKAQSRSYYERNRERILARKRERYSAAKETAA